MPHANARLTVHGRLLLVARVVDGHRPVAHVAAELGISRQCAHRWVARYRRDGPQALQDRSSRPHTSPAATSDVREQEVLAARTRHRRGQDWIGAELGMSARTLARVLRRHAVPYLRERPADRPGHPRIEEHRGALRARPIWGTGAPGRL